MTIELPLSNGFVALIDDDQAHLLEYRWHYVNGYARRQEWRSRKFVRNVYLHQQVTGYPMTDHRNGDRLDCRRSNLRPATSLLNAHNRFDRDVPGVGVRWNKGTWVARLGAETVGCFRTKEAAIGARSNAIQERWLTSLAEADRAAAVEALRR